MDFRPRARAGQVVVRSRVAVLTDIESESHSLLTRSVMQINNGRCKLKPTRLVMIGVGMAMIGAAND